MTLEQAEAAREDHLKMRALVDGGKVVGGLNEEVHDRILDDLNELIGALKACPESAHHLLG
jgi:hypothetical protein